MNATNNNRSIQSHTEIAAVDVITVWHNRDYAVESSLMSLVTQSMQRIRIVAVDDGSNDATAEKLDEMKEFANDRGVEMVVWRKDNEGFTKSLRKAIERFATANYIALHGAGDVSCCDRLRRQYDIASTHECSVVGSWVIVRDARGRVEKRRQPAFVQERNGGGLRIPRPGTHGAALIKKECYDAIGGYREEFEYAQDADLWLRISRVAPILNCQEYLYEKLRYGNSVGTSRVKERLQKKYSTLALQSASCVEERGVDIVEGVNPGNIDAYVDSRLLGERRGATRLRRGLKKAREAFRRLM